jgi:hypothetical protein
MNILGHGIRGVWWGLQQIITTTYDPLQLTTSDCNWLQLITATADLTDLYWIQLTITGYSRWLQLLTNDYMKLHMIATDNNWPTEYNQLQVLKTNSNCLQIMTTEFSWLQLITYEYIQLIITDHNWLQLTETSYN